MVSCEDYVASKAYWEDLCKKCNKMGESMTGFVDYLGTQYDLKSDRDVTEL